ncbi:hypothetical protein D0Z03_000919 [Geotrichum reessii]|nr:hypothetical protein D0Z03_000919 [Galactomyces reessii]
MLAARRFAAHGVRGLRTLSTVTPRVTTSSQPPVNANAARNELLTNLRRAFPNTDTLHPRIDLLLHNDDGKVRIALVPFHVHRNNVKGVLDAVLADPLASDLEWYDALTNRLLGKNTLVSYAPNFDKNTITHNSLVEYGVNFSVPKAYAKADSTVQRADQIDIIEVNNYKDSQQHLWACHRHVYLCSDARMAYTKPLVDTYPHDLFLDVEPAHAGDRSSSIKVEIISSAAANQANSLLRASTANSSEYAKLLDQSHIDLVFDSIFGRDLTHSEAEVLRTIISTCEAIVDKEEEVTFDISAESTTITKQRQKWSAEAHLELQTTFTNALKELAHSKIPWWKLYFKVDEVHQTASETLFYYFLPRTQDRFEYLLGRIDQFAEEHHFPPLPASTIVDTTAAAGTTSIIKTEDISNMFKASRDDIISELAVDLHNTALRELLKNLVGVQLPLVVLPLLGVYFFDYSLYAAGSVITLGLAVGASRLQKAWLKATTHFTNSALDKAKLTIEQCEHGIWQRWEAQIKNQQSAAASRREIINNLKKTMT